MKILFLGDISGNSGPSMVNKNLLNQFKNNKNIFFLNKSNKFQKLMQCIKKLVKVDIINVSGIGIINFIAVLLGKVFKKKIVYIMHGAVKIEKNFSEYPFYYPIFENITIKYSDKIVCVSERFIEVLLKDKYYKKFKDKYTSINNGVNLNVVDKTKLCVKKDINTIVSLGGGRKEKNNIKVCEAIKKLNLPNIKYVIIGRKGKDIENIAKYEFVEYKGKISHEEVIKEMRKANIYIQNSIYEPFGIAPLEALNEGCSLILSKNIGMLNIFKKIPDKTVVDPMNVDEITHTILYRLTNSNNKELLDTIDREKIKWSEISKRYLDLWYELNQNKQLKDV